MTTAQYKAKFGVSKTTYENLLIKKLVNNNEKPTAQAIAEYKLLRKKRKAHVRDIQHKKHEEAKRVRRLSSKPRKRRDGKVRGSVNR